MWPFNNPGILGINARNLLYIKPYNPKKAIMFADSKLKTKNFLSTRGIPTARLYAVINTKKELKEFDWKALPESFVIKPNAGYGGEGIVVVDDKKKIDLKKMTRHINDILDGRYSIADLSDKAIFEQKLENAPPFSEMAVGGLADIRVIVHNLIPVMAMLRLPTEASQGKANVHMGGIGVGIDIAKGETTYATQRNRLIEEIPRFGKAGGVRIPGWEDILLMASRVQQITNLGYAAVDIALDKELGPALLEMNARAGLMVQVANLAPLRRRLERIEGIKVSTPEKGVRIAQDIFGEKIEKKQEKQSEKVVIGTLEVVELIGKNQTQKILAQIDPHAAKTVLDEKTARKIGIDKSLKLKFNLAEQRVQTMVELKNLEQEKFQMRVGQRDLRNFVIDPFIRPPHLTRKFTEEKLREIDAEICDIDSKIRLLGHLRPANLSEEREKFLKDPTYNPQFQLRPLDFDPIHLLSRLKRLELPDSPLGILWHKKCSEIRRKIELLEVRGHPQAFTEKSLALYGGVESGIEQDVRAQLQRMPREFPAPAKFLTAAEAVKWFKKAIEEHGLKGWTVKLKEELVSDAIAGKENVIFVRAGATFGAERLRGTIAHEIETHAFTAANGHEQPYKIFQRGLADYITTEEGLAVYNQERTESSETEKKYWPASSVIGVAAAMKGSFVDVYNALIALGFSADRAWKVALKAKRGLTDTSQPGGFTKDCVYYKGHQKILDFIARGGDLRDLYYGKINMDDLPLIKKIKGLKKPVYLPKYLQNAPQK